MHPAISCKYSYKAADELPFIQAKLSERNQKSGQRRFCLKVALEQKQTIMHYQPRKTRPFFKIVVATPNLVAQSRGDMTDNEITHLKSVAYKL